jgi:DNA-binding NtrC family response regulator
MACRIEIAKVPVLILKKRVYEEFAMGMIPDLSGLSILIMEEDPASLGNGIRELERFGARVVAAPDLGNGMDILSRQRIDAVMASLDLVDETFIERVREYKAAYPGLLLYLLTEEGYESVEVSIASVRSLVDDYIQKPVDAPRLAGMIAANIGRPSTGSSSLTVIEPLVARVKPYFLFRSPAMRRALSHIPEIAASGQTVLISGETGSGKELVARAVHVLSRRANGPFVPINCGAIPESLIEDELFGHEKGAFTGAHAARKGKFETANGGTLFLDEIGDMALSLQVRLLRVLEEKKTYRVGAEHPVHINVRVIAATRVDLEKAVKDGLFREDLYYRLNVLRISLPPLRERVEDISLLAVHFLERAFDETGRVPPHPVLSPETIHILERFPWKGNVRELRNIMTRVATLIPPGAGRIFPFHVLPHLGDGRGVNRPLSQGGDRGVVIPVGTPLVRAEELLIREALKQAGGNRTQAAKLLGISPRTLRRRLGRESS